MSRFNHIPSGDTLRRDAISSLKRGPKKPILLQLHFLSPLAKGFGWEIMKCLPCMCVGFMRECVCYCIHPWCPDGQAGGRSGRQQEKVCPGCISETVRCRKLSRDIGLGVVGVQRHGVTLI